MSYKKSPAYRSAVLDLYSWQYPRHSMSFYSMLYHLIEKADLINQAKLKQVYPYHIQAYRDWNEAGRFGQDLFLEVLGYDHPSGEPKK